MQTIRTFLLLSIFVGIFGTLAYGQDKGSKRPDSSRVREGSGVDTAATVGAMGGQDRSNDRMSLPARDTSHIDTLKTFTVSGNKPFMVRKAGKIILHIAESPLAAGGNAFDIMQHVPGIQIEADNLQWHGKSVRVLLDGKTTGMTGSDLRVILEGMASGSVDRVEVIENPGASYDAQGGVVINIITSKAKKAGLNGSLTAGLGGGQYLRENAGISLNYRQGSWNVYGGYDYQHRKPTYDYFSERRVDSLRSVVENTHGTRGADDHLLRFGIERNNGGKSSFGLLFRGMLDERKNDASNRSVLSGRNPMAGGGAITSGNGSMPGGGQAPSGGGTLPNVGDEQQDSISTVGTRGHSRLVIPSVNAWYKLAVDTAGSTLTMNADYFHYSKTWKEDLLTRYTNAKGDEVAAPLYLRDQSPAINSIRSLSADYVRPGKGFELESGLKASWTTTDNDVLWEQQQGDSWLKDAGKTNHFIYRENIYAGYVTIDKTIKKYEFQAGLRGEQTNTAGQSLTLGQTATHHYFNIFPSLALQYSAADDKVWNLSYRKSIERFSFDVVNPFVRYISQYSYYQGNPAIRPSVSHNFTLSYSYKGVLFPSISYSRFHDALGEVYMKKDSSDAVINSDANLGSADQVVLDITTSKSLFGGKWVVNNSIGGMYAKYDRKLDAQQAGAKLTAYVTSDHLFTFSGGWKAEVTGMYYSPLVLGVFTYHSRYSVDLGVSKSVLKGQGKLALNVSDVFNTMKDRYDVASFGVSSLNTRKAESRVAKLVFTWKFGSKKQQNSSSRRTGIDDLRQRMGGN